MSDRVMKIERKVEKKVERKVEKKVESKGLIGKRRTGEKIDC